MGRPPWAAALAAAADCVAELDVLVVADAVVELLVAALVLEVPDPVEVLPLALDVTAEALDVVATVLDVVAAVLEVMAAALDVEAAALDVTAAALEVVAWDVVRAAVLEPAEVEVLAVAAVPAPVDVWANAGTGVTVGDVAVPVAPALHAASKATLLAAPTRKSKRKQRRRSIHVVAVGPESMPSSLCRILRGLYRPPTRLSTSAPIQAGSFH